MDKYPLIGVSICAVILLILASLSNVVGYQTVQSSNQTVIDNEVNQKEVLFQTILDIANNKDIQKIILKSQMTNGKFFDSNMKFSAFNIPVLTKNQLKHMYLVGLILSKFLSKSRMHSIIGKYQFNNQEMQKEITAVIEKDATLDGEIKQLSNSQCDCENEKTTEWRFPVICILLSPLWIVAAILAITSNYGFYFVEIMGYIGMKLNCFWNIVPSKG